MQIFVLSWACAAVPRRAAPPPISYRTSSDTPIVLGFGFVEINQNTYIFLNLIFKRHFVIYGLVLRWRDRPPKAGSATKGWVDFLLSLHGLHGFHGLWHGED